MENLTIQITLTLDKAEFMSSVFDNSAFMSWVQEWDWDYKNPNETVKIKHENEDEEIVTTFIKAEDLARGLEIAIRNNYHHCGVPITPDFDDWDACVSNDILQLAIFGELVFG